MSGKIKSKDLQYDSTLPPFLQRLRAQNTGYGPDKDPDRHEQQGIRPKKAKNPDDDDGPTVVDESGETLSKEDYAKLSAAGEKSDETASGTVTGDLTGDGKPEASGALPAGKGAEKVTDGVAQKKRKVAKVIGDDDAEDAKATKDGEDASTKKTAKKPKKKAKPIKLAFDDEDG